MQKLKQLYSVVQQCCNQVSISESCSLCWTTEEKLKVARDVELAETASRFFSSGEYLPSAFQQQKCIHRVEHLLIDDIPIKSYPAGITPFNLQTCRQFPSITS
jgi:hypothetical protein